MPDWNSELRDARTSREVSRKDLADCSGLSLDSLRSYEFGRRRPTREHLLRLMTCLNLDDAARDHILVSAGFAPVASPERFPQHNIPTNEALRLIRERPWPAYLLNHRVEVLAISRPAECVLAAVGGQSRLFGRPRSVLTAATRRALTSHFENWSAAIPGLIALFKAGVPEEPSLVAPGPYLKAVLKQVTAGDPALITRFMTLWETTPPFQGRIAGAVYPVTWKVGQGKIQFRVLINCLNTEVGLYAHNFFPSDSKSHALLEKLLADWPR